MPHEWTPETFADRYGIPGGTQIVAGCCRRTVLANSLLMRQGEESVVCSGCLDAAERMGQGPELLAELGAPASTVERSRERIARSTPRRPEARGLVRPVHAAHLLRRRASVAIVPPDAAPGAYAGLER